MSLIRHLSPFAPDQSGAVSALFELGGIIVICDAGGCTGNICGFDEPRWFEHKSAVFSAGLRDMDAILGRDDALIAKLADAASAIDASFTAIVSTPVPVVIGTDFRALKRMAEKRCGIPCLTIETLGTQLYDRGEEQAWTALFQTFATEELPVREKTAGVLGATPLEFGYMGAADAIGRALGDRGFSEVRVFGMGSGLDDVRRASEDEINIVVSPAGLPAARYLKKTFGTPYECCCPCIPKDLSGRFPGFAGKRVLVIHQQVYAHEVARAIHEACGKAGLQDAETEVATWFMLDREIADGSETQLRSEEDLARLVEEGGFDVILGDAMLAAAIAGYGGEFIDLPHFAVSGRVLQWGDALHG